LLLKQPAERLLAGERCAATRKRVSCLRCGTANNCCTPRRQRTEGGRRLRNLAEARRVRDSSLILVNSSTLATQALAPLLRALELALRSRLVAGVRRGSSLGGGLLRRPCVRSTCRRRRRHWRCTAHRLALAPGGEQACARARERMRRSSVRTRPRSAPACSAMAARSLRGKWSSAAADGAAGSCDAAPLRKAFSLRSKTNS
jgi:hypothetical protein